MPEFSFVAQTHQGTIERGHLRGATAAEVRDVLTARGRRLVGIQQAKTSFSPTTRLLKSTDKLRLRSLRARDVELWLQQLAVMLESGLELTPSLRELAIHSPKKLVRRVCNELADAVEQGSSLESAITASQLFPPIVSQLARIGEDTGELPITLQRAAEFIERRRQVHSDIVSAMAYPMLVATAACSVAVYLVGWAIPKLAVFLQAMGRKLPSMTQSLLDISQFVQHYGPGLAVVLVASLIGLALVYAFQPGRYQIDRWLLRIPLIGRLLQMAETQQLASSLALMLRSGVFLPDAISTASKLHRNHYLAAHVAGLASNLRWGKISPPRWLAPVFRHF